MISSASTKVAVLTRKLSTTRTRFKIGEFNDMKWDFGTIHLKNKKHLKEQKEKYFNSFEKPHGVKSLKIHKHARGTGVRHEAYWEHVPEMVPELVVPDLSGFKLKPYVSYRTKDVFQEAMTAKDLFNITYGKKIIADYKQGKLDERGEPLEPSDSEKMTADEAVARAKRTGTDVFEGGVERSKLWKLQFSRR